MEEAVLNGCMGGADFHCGGVQTGCLVDDFEVAEVDVFCEDVDSVSVCL